MSDAGCCLSNACGCAALCREVAGAVVRLKIEHVQKLNVFSLQPYKEEVKSTFLPLLSIIFIKMAENGLPFCCCCRALIGLNATHISNFFVATCVAHPFQSPNRSLVNRTTFSERRKGSELSESAKEGHHPMGDVPLWHLHR